ncbi:nucleotide sugar dehydrogenase [Aeromicrobium chenweiae]|uniref:Nucleotide sugar dehydrogenase n=1 Tax=Aeromicrobium chenweiae TaxID=2079793 RepID=A0A2S0WIG7_9ACTN|nr:nucleotide sugar dehydrogenase [Aeromicrobium chenweiae]AWB91128.1 nucleotide sugar dehydrogenase [Aeromicrobium chenweiae]TGN31647.1 nucleotide sugar dehydrogenase [Aeromicrobium chenweiae]
MSVDMAIIGLGYVGLPLAQQAARSGLTVTGFDVNAGMVETLNGGTSHIDDLSDADIAEMISLGFTASTDETVLADADAIVICVPTPLSLEGEPDLGAVIAATTTIARQLRPGHLVVLESTTYPGTTDEVVRPILEKGGLVAGVDFHLAFSPERVDPGNPTYGIANTPKVVGGHTPKSTEVATGFYGRFIDTVVPSKGTREAEMTKLLENTYRHINIALVNEMAQFCHEMDIDLWEVIRNAATKPFGFQAFYPGPGVGGHCIPIDPNYLSFKVRSTLGRPFQFVELAQSINLQMPSYVVERVADLLNDAGRALNGSTILLLGVTYKPNIADQRESPATPLAGLLRDKAAKLLFHDPRVESWAPGGVEVTRADDLDEALRTADVTVLLQNHREYDLEHIAATARTLFDTKGATDVPGVERL